jgi:hypothetical protein
MKTPANAVWIPSSTPHIAENHEVLPCGVCCAVLLFRPNSIKDRVLKRLVLRHVVTADKHMLSRLTSSFGAIHDHSVATGGIRGKRPFIGSALTVQSGANEPISNGFPWALRKVANLSPNV